MKLSSLMMFVSVLVSGLQAAPFGKVVPVGGHVSDIALDSRRGLLYIANFGANRIDVLATSDLTLRPPVRVPAQPSTLAISPDGRYLVVGHYATWQEGTATTQPAITILDLDAGRRQTLALSDSVLAVAFGNGSRALVVTAKDFRLLDPSTGTLQLLASGSDLKTEELPVSFPKFPPEIVQASTGVSGDGNTIYVLAQGQEMAAVVQFRVPEAALAVVGIKAQPELGPRVISVNRNGSLFVAGWALLTPQFIGVAQFPYPTGKLDIGSHAFDWLRGVIYAQIPVNETQASSSDSAPVLHVVDSDNLRVRERIQLRENLAGRSLFSPDMQTLYAISASGITVLPVGALDKAARVVSRQEDVLFRGNACDRKPIVREIQIVDPSGSGVDFAIGGERSGVRISPSAGTTPATVRIEVDPAVFQNSKGTVAIPLELRSSAAVNLPPPVQLLINTHEPEQRGVIADIPGKLVDLMADPVRNRFYIIRQDTNEVLVFASNGALITRLRTGNTPTQMAQTRDYRYLIVGHDNSQLAAVYDLETLKPSAPIIFPPGHYPRSIAVSRRAILASVRNISSPENKIDRIDFESRRASELPSLGIYKNSIHVDTVLMASPSGLNVIAAMPDGNVLLYDADSDTFVAARKDLPEVSGALAALSDQTFLVGDNILNWSLVPVTKLDAGSVFSSGIAFVDGLGLRTTSPSAAAPGTIQRFRMDTFDAVRPTMMIESPLLSDALRTPPVGQIGQTILPFLRTLAPLRDRSSIVSLTASGITVLPWDFDVSLERPSIQAIVNSADQSNAVAPGGLVTIYGKNLSPVSAVNSELPVPTTLGEACLTANGVLLPMMQASPGRIDAQLPYSVTGNAKLVLRSPGGTSEGFDFMVQAGAPAVFRSGSAGPATGLATVVRTKNNELVTLSNPIHPEDEIVIYLTGLGTTSPELEPGAPGPLQPLATASSAPQVWLGNVPLPLLYAGLVPGEVGVYQINAKVPYWVSTGTAVALTISQNGNSTELPVRVVH